MNNVFGRIYLLPYCCAQKIKIELKDSFDPLALLQFYFNYNLNLMTLLFLVLLFLMYNSSLIDEKKKRKN